MGHAFEERISTVLYDMKRFEKNKEYVCIPILNERKGIIGFLKPITVDYQAIFPDCVSTFSRWRSENPSLSNSVFQVTDERTRNWLDHMVLPSKDRLFFFIDDLNNRHLGHIALSRFNYETESGFVDSVLRGELCDIPDLMYHTIMTLQKWMIERLKCKRIFLVTNVDNVRAIKLYTRCGFKIIGKQPLYRKKMENETRWDPDTDGDEKTAERYEYLMESLEPEKWRSTHGV